MPGGPKSNLNKYHLQRVIPRFRPPPPSALGGCFTSLSRRPRELRPLDRTHQSQLKRDSTGFHDKDQRASVRRGDTVWKGRLILAIRTTFPKTPFAHSIYELTSFLSLSCF